MTEMKPTVLAVEDDPEFRKALEIVLGRFGLDVTTVESAEEFMQKLVRPYDLYLVDLQLGNRNGFELITELRKTHGVTSPILVISGGRKTELIAHAIELGANDYIMKPLDRTLLAAKLSKYVNSPSMIEHRPLFTNIPKDEAVIRVEFSAEVLEVDELGIRLRSNALVPKGTVLKLRCEALRAAGIAEGEVLVAVSSTQLSNEGLGYQMYVEFDGVDVQFMETVRRWLAQS